jgi:hypothetical protein
MLELEDDLFIRSNLSPKRTGLPIVVWNLPARRGVPRCAGQSLEGA